MVAGQFPAREGEDRRVREGQQAAAVHEAAAVHVPRLGAERAAAAPFGVELLVEWPGALLERIALPHPPAGELALADEVEPVVVRYRLVFAHRSAASSAVTPGSCLPSIHSRKAPPAVET